jgi:hypothetical protein
MGEQRTSGQKKCYLANLPAGTNLARWLPPNEPGLVAGQMLLALVLDPLRRSIGCAPT